MLAHPNSLAKLSTLVRALWLNLRSGLTSRR
jgi:hypothetical protein